MRGLVMTPRSVYRQVNCMYCHKPIRPGRAFLGSTYYVTPPQSDRSRRPIVTTYQRDRQIIGNHRYDVPDEIQVRVTYHRACVESVLSRTPLDPAESISQMEAYRQSLLERYGIDGVNADSDGEALHV